MSKNLAFAESFLKFVDASPTAFHAVDECRKKLVDAGYALLKEGDSWDLRAGGRYYFTRNQSTIIAFSVGGAYKPGNGFKIVAAHTDSPHLKLKPKSYVKEKSGYHTLGVECYGGGIWHSWFDRDLTVAGRVLVSDASNNVAHRLVHIKKPLCRISSLAIHLDRSANESFAFNKEDQLRPIFASEIKTALEGGADAQPAKDAVHHPAFVRVIANELKCEPGDIRDFELGVVDAQNAAIGGMFDEFVFASRLDNLLSCHVALTALLNAGGKESIDNDEGVRMVAFFDHEEVGSSSAQGAASSLLLQTMHRITTMLNPSNAAPSDLQDIAISRSFLISMDMAHAVHPCYSSKHEESHQPAIHKGIAIKTNQNQRYATNAQTGFLFREIARRSGVPFQEFVVRNDSACGSTIGPILASNCGIRTVDVGIPQLSMHSVREMCGVDDMQSAHEAVAYFFVNYEQVNRTITID